MGIAPGTSDTAACGITRVGVADGVVFEFDVADREMFALGVVEIEEFRVGELDIEVLALIGIGEFAMIDRFEIKFESPAPNASASNISAERTCRAAFAAGVADVTAMAGLNWMRFLPTLVVLNCRHL
jgi:hypothetical protein